MCLRGILVLKDRSEAKVSRPRQRDTSTNSNMSRSYLIYVGDSRGLELAGLMCASQLA